MNTFYPGRRGALWRVISSQLISSMHEITYVLVGALIGISVRVAMSRGQFVPPLLGTLVAGAAGALIGGYSAEILILLESSTMFLVHSIGAALGAYVLLVLTTPESTSGHEGVL